MPSFMTSSGLLCSHGSNLDLRIPKAKCPSSALPEEVRAKMGLKPRKEIKRRGRRASGGANLYEAGGGCVKPRESKDGKYAAGCQKNFLRKGSGKAMSERASYMAQKRLIQRRKTKSQPTQALVPVSRTSGILRKDKRTSEHGKVVQCK